MGLRMILGPSGSGKSTYVCKRVIQAAEENPRQSYLVIVPDQFTMQTQMDFVKESRNKGIMNVEVLSFSRLAHRVFEETGNGRTPVLDDTGKNLILRQCADAAGTKIPYLSDKINKPGFIHEVKSAISEFMQYGIDESKIEELIGYAAEGNKRTLEKKLKDLSVIYGLFKDYIKDKYITTEETLDVLARDIYRCHIAKDSVVIFDGFTGFTPIQNKVLEALMDVAKDIEITLTLDGIDPVSKLSTDSVNENDLFALTRKTFFSLSSMAQNHGLETKVDIMQPGARYGMSSELSFMERQFLRPTSSVYNNDCYDIKISSYATIRDDVRGLAHNIKALLRDKGACYRDIAVITGNMESYSGELEEVLAEYDIPYYLDKNKGIVCNPFVEFIKSSLEIISADFSYDAVFRYLRTGFAGIGSDDTDMLDNYITAVGIRGLSAYSRPFVKSTAKMRRNDNVTEELEKLNEIRHKFMDSLNPLIKAGVVRTKAGSASEYVMAIYEFITNNGCASVLKEYAEKFENEARYELSGEYSQIYKLTMKLLEQINALIGQESMVPEDFLKLLEAGFDEIEVGTIPQSVDRVIIGDMERTRLKPVKYLFFLGLNDGWVPKDTGKGGLISDADREYLADSNIELAPTPRSQVYIDRFYLYCNLTKPSEKLYLSYVAMDDEMKAARPSYVIEHIKSIFPALKISEGAAKDVADNIGSLGEAKVCFSDLVREYALGTEDLQREEYIKILHAIIGDKDYINGIVSNAFFSYEKKDIGRYIAGLLYGSRLYTSISRMEKYAGCAYAYFLKYGLSLEEREEYGIEAADLGNVYHGVLETFAGLLAGKGLDWNNFTDEQAEELINEAVEAEAARYTDALFFENEKNRYVADRMKKVMLRTVKTLAYQMKMGEFTPYEYEYEFEREVKTTDGKTKVNGKIDRLDIKKAEDKVLVKVTDYKSGKKEFSLMCFYYGVQLQMVVYMNGAVEKIAKEFPGKEMVPAAMLYYRIKDPIVDEVSSGDESVIEQKINKELMLRGLVDDSDEVVISLDKSLAEGNEDKKSKAKSDVFANSSDTKSRADMMVISRFADKKAVQLTERMVSGDISIDPKEIRKSASTTEFDSCEYCEYAGVCGFDEHMPGYHKQLIKKEDDAVLLEKMKAEL